VTYFRGWHHEKKFWLATNVIQSITSLAATNRCRRGFANIWSLGSLPREHSPDGATWAHNQ